MMSKGSDEDTSLREIFTSPLTRRAVLGGWSVALSAAFINASIGANRERRLSKIRKRELFKSITTDNKEFRCHIMGDARN